MERSTGRLGVGKPVEILLVEDNPGDVELTRQGLQAGKIVNNLHVVDNGEDALAFLRREGAYVDVPRPDLILLDLNLPTMDGHEVLTEIRSDPALTDLPVVILTTSASDDDVRRAYAGHANSFMTKPVGFDSFVELTRELGDYWFSLVKLPG